MSNSLSLEKNKAYGALECDGNNCQDRQMFAFYSDRKLQDTISDFGYDSIYAESFSELSDKGMTYETLLTYKRPQDFFYLDLIEGVNYADSFYRFRVGDGNGNACFLGVLSRQIATELFKMSLARSDNQFKLQQYEYKEFASYVLQYHFSRNHCFLYKKTLSEDNEIYLKPCFEGYVNQAMYYIAQNTGAYVVTGVGLNGYDPNREWTWTSKASDSGHNKNPEFMTGTYAKFLKDSDYHNSFYKTLPVNHRRDASEPSY